MKHLAKTLLTTNPKIGFSIARLTLGLVIFPHGAQKLLGLFGGYGYSATIDFFTTQMGLPGIIAFSIIMIEFFGSISLILGFISRFWALSLAGMFLGIIYTTQLEHGFFMNWFGNQAGEGFEYSLLIIGLALSIVINGSGKWSIDKLISKKQ
ncbi:putative oxidoreductase [Arenibacter algicola]|jgi:putative oxidoreductase|uniref:Oxidoreductase n=1 Tax=Arenibacter algicola TaxID=616991 RepID=A0ABY3A9H2_9FLAO|nr:MULTISPECIES: DoxX family protein [Arenibacter]MDX1769182.1 DoxX family protein [Arenibacter troitsensis]GBF20740.1 putative oxidoreductase MhqP [Arenibacter sp. NBRC 103722]|tara:strand:- start:19952 stop:20407 length:456 start_codon:yes stop_codon:yes gene_type:complete